MSKTMQLLMISIIASQPCLPAERSFSLPLLPSKKATATVRQGNNYCAKELQAFAARNPVSQKALERFIGSKINTTSMPKIAIVGSGGGTRAAIATYGFLSGLEKIGLLDAAQYIAGVSGSTWGIASWLTSPLPIDQLMTLRRKKLDNALSPEKLNELSILKAFTIKATATRSATINDIWGCFLADLFLSSEKDDGQDFCFSDLADMTLAGKCPIALLTSVISETYPLYQWVEFSPFEIGSTSLNTWVSTSAFGKKFDKGTSYDKRPEEKLSYLIGLFGSAYAASAHKIITTINHELKKKYHMGFEQSLIDELIKENNTPVVAPDIKNFVYNLKDTPLNKEKELSLIDAGFAFSFPFPPLLRRNVSVYLICEASGNASSAGTNDMHLVEKYAKQNNFKLPYINYSVLASSPLSIWADADPETPIIIFAKNMHPFPTFKFDYTPAEFDLLSKGMEDAVVANAAAIKLAIQKVIAKKA